jgi:hypothetical protein
MFLNDTGNHGECRKTTAIRRKPFATHEARVRRRSVILSAAAGFLMFVRGLIKQGFLRGIGREAQAHCHHGDAEDQGDNALCRFTHFKNPFFCLFWLRCHAYGLFSSYAATRFTWNHLLCV